MAFFLSPYLTEYDESLSGDSYIDPIGTLIIWSAFGRNVFNGRVNSVSNDVRNYTLNLFHHHLLRRLVTDDAVRLGDALLHQYRNKDALGFKQACLLLLENLFTFSMLRHDQMPDVHTGGVLGLSKARQRWTQSGGKPQLVFTHGSEGQVLVRQLGLGVSGRYKSPLMQIGFFDDLYQYHIPRFQARWVDAENFIHSTLELACLERELFPFLKAQLSKLSHKGTIDFSDVPVRLTEAYVAAFRSPKSVGAYARDFWLVQTGLDSGAAGAIFQVLKNESTELDSCEVIRRAIDLASTPDDKIKLEQIERVEPFLAECALLFSLMIADRDHAVDTVAESWTQSYQRSETYLSDLAARAGHVALLPMIAGTEAGRRFTALQKAANAGSVADQIRALAKYQSKVMQGRRQPAWLSIEDGGQIKVHARTSAAPKPERRPPGTWYNDYYLSHFRNLVKGFEGVGP